jgi:hypothetical protein
MVIISTIFISSIPTPGVSVKAASNFNQIPFDYYDLNDDWIIDIIDLANMAKNYNTTDESMIYFFDLNNDNFVDIYDITLLSKALGQEQGNTYGNLNSGGLIAKKGNWRYFRNQTDNGYLYKINNLSTEIKKVCDDMPSYINVIGNWIYYSNVSDNCNLYKIRTDGSERTRLNSDFVQGINIIDNWIYYVSYGTIYKIRMDGSERTNIISDNISYINVVGDVIYYNTKYTNFNSSLYKINTNGTGKTKVCDGAEYFNYYDGYIYYTSASPYGNNILHKIKPDGSNETTINTSRTASLIVSYGGIFYSGIFDGYSAVCYTTLDGTTTRTISTNFAADISVLGDSLYIQRLDNYLYEVTPTKCIPLGTYPIKKVDNLSLNLIKGSSYTLTSYISAIAFDDTTVTATVLWDEPTVDTTTQGTHVYEGVVLGYPEKIKCTITIQ